ncbi:hypothetical protein EDB19DRAFT_1825594 [Suillus lakei]|nr:hypothetical protein EDB19DRAFT_1825594 [Suillus lakei]
MQKTSPPLLVIMGVTGVMDRATENPTWTRETMPISIAGMMDRKTQKLTTKNLAWMHTTMAVTAILDSQEKDIKHLKVDTNVKSKKINELNCLLPWKECERLRCLQAMRQTIDILGN